MPHTWPQPMRAGGSVGVGRAAFSFRTCEHTHQRGFSGQCGARQPQDVPAKKADMAVGPALSRDAARAGGNTWSDPVHLWPAVPRSVGGARSIQSRSGPCTMGGGSRFMGLVEGGFRGLSNTARPYDRDLGKMPARGRLGRLGFPGHPDSWLGSATCSARRPRPILLEQQEPILETSVCLELTTAGSTGVGSLQGQAVHRQVGFLLLTPGGLESRERGAPVSMTCSVGTGLALNEAAPEPCAAPHVTRSWYLWTPMVGAVRGCPCHRGGTKCAFWGESMLAGGPRGHRVK